MINSNSLNKSFATHEELFRELKKAEKNIIAAKKASILKSAERGQLSDVNFINKDMQADKSVFKDGFVYPVINTTNFLDSHEDVHFPNIWNKTISDKQGKIYLLADHNSGISNIVAWPTDVKVFTKMVDWSMVGKNYAGQTQALIYEVAEENIQHAQALKFMQEKRPLLGSVAMQYVKIELAVNSNEQDYIENKKLWNNKINTIANVEDVNEKGYFFAVTEAKIMGEGSILTNPSNPATQIIYPESQPSNTDTAKEEPLISTPKFEDFVKYMNTNF